MRSLLLALCLLSVNVFAWGGRGHATICELAPFFVKNPKLKEFLTFRPHVMGHLCNVPDVYWKSLTTDAAKMGSSGHYINPENIGLALQDLPLNYSEISKTHSGKVKNMSKEFGGLWWRADQFLRLGAQQKTLLTGATTPTNREQEQDEKLPYNLGVYQWMVNMGLLGHFVGDASMPYHNHSDHDGWQSGHGGIHSYYEDAVVGQFDGDLHQLVLKRARQLMLKAKTLPYLKGTPLERMKALSIVSAAEVAKVKKLDPILKKSEEKMPAVRKPIKVGLGIYKDLIVEQMARSVVLLASLWEDSYVEIGAPDLSHYRSYRFPFTPEFVPLDYVSSDKPN